MEQSSEGGDVHLDVELKNEKPQGKDDSNEPNQNKVAGDASKTEDAGRTKNDDTFHHIYGGHPTKHDNIFHGLERSNKTVKQRVVRYFRKFKGDPNAKPPAGRHGLINNLLSFLGSFIGIGINAVINQYAFNFTGTQFVLLLGAWGATSILLYSEFHSPLAQPRNLFVGSFVSSLIAVVLNNAITISGIREWLQPWTAALSVSCALLAMHYTKAVHPPGGAIALLGILQSVSIFNYFSLILVPMV
ncbi:5 TM domain-containing transmembrane protein [Acrasis kona]|uniref:5 TM domain-containing transmembrane protein n=1 Tax=Acrasis kona TaxID=1008807 RepID=A0AAW2ZCG9_9EUKA